MRVPSLLMACCAALGLAACGTSVTGNDAGTHDVSATDIATDVPRDASVSPDALDGSFRPDGFEMDATAGYDDLTVVGTGLGIYEGLTFHLALVDTSIGRVVQTATVVVTGGAFQVFWPRAFNRSLYGMFLYVYADLDGDGHCTVNDETWSIFVNNDFRTGGVMVDFSPGDGGAMGADCMYFP